MNAGPAGFRGAPLSKVLVVASLASSIIVQTAARASRRRPPPLLNAFTHAFVFKHPGELVMGTMLAYYFRILERQMGSAKYGTYAIISCGISYAVQAALTTLVQRPSASGMYPLIFANLVAFFLEIPPLQKFTFLGLQMSDKVFVYVAALQLLFSSQQRSLAAGLSGVLAGMVYHFDFFGIRRLRLPRVVEDAFGQTFGRAIGGTVQQQQIFVTPAAQHQQQGAGATRPAGFEVPGGAAAAAAQLSVEPSEEALQQLIDMGFDQVRARHALQRSNNSVELALQSLL